MINSRFLLWLHLDNIDNCSCHSSVIKYANDLLIYVNEMQKKLNGYILELHN